MELACLDMPDGMLVPGQVLGEVFWWFPAGHIRGVIETLPLDQVEQAGSYVLMVKLAVEDLIDFPLIRVIQFNWWWCVQYPVGDLTSASGLQ